MSLFPTKILVAIDGSDSSDPALRAAELSEKIGSEVNVIYVGKDVPAPAAYNEPSSSDQEAAQKAQELLDEKARQVEEAGERIAESYVVPGDDPADEIFELTKESDIGFVVVGSRGLGPLQDTVQNSVSSTVVRDASCPVLTVGGGTLLKVINRRPQGARKEFEVGREQQGPEDERPGGWRDGPLRHPRGGNRVRQRGRGRLQTPDARGVRFLRAATAGCIHRDPLARCKKRREQAGLSDSCTV